MAVFDWGRDGIDKAMMAIGRDFWDAAVALGDSFVAEVPKIARKHGIDPGYLFFVLGENLPAAKRLAGPNGKSLGIAWNLMAARGRSRGYNRFNVPTDEDAVDAAIKQVALWSATDFKKEVAKAFMGAVKKHTPKIQAELDAQNIKSKPLSIVLDELPLRLDDHGFWYQSPTQTSVLFNWLTG